MQHCWLDQSHNIEHLQHSSLGIYGQ